jgi:hypothetical protein
MAAPQDAKDVGEGFGSAAGARSKADVPVAKVVNPPIVPRTNGEDIPSILKDSLHQRTGSMQVVHFVGGDYDMYRRRGIGVRAWRRGYGKGAWFLDASVHGSGLDQAGQPSSESLISGKDWMEHKVRRFDRRANIAPNSIRAAATHSTPYHTSLAYGLVFGALRFKLLVARTGFQTSVHLASRLAFTLIADNGR